jgi:hypothetical protein
MSSTYYKKNVCLYIYFLVWLSSSYIGRTAELSCGFRSRIFTNFWFLKSWKFQCAKFNFDLLISWHKTTEQIFVKEMNQAARLNTITCYHATCIRSTALHIFRSLKYSNYVTHLRITRYLNDDFLKDWYSNSWLCKTNTTYHKSFP